MARACRTTKLHALFDVSRTRAADAKPLRVHHGQHDGEAETTTLRRSLQRSKAWYVREEEREGGRRWTTCECSCIHSFVRASLTHSRRTAIEQVLNVRRQQRGVRLRSVALEDVAIAIEQELHAPNSQHRSE